LQEVEVEAAGVVGVVRVAYQQALPQYLLVPLIVLQLAQAAMEQVGQTTDPVVLTQVHLE
jgi:hypothetical protein